MVGREIQSNKNHKHDVDSFTLKKSNKQEESCSWLQANQKTIFEKTSVEKFFIINGCGKIIYK